MTPVWIIRKLPPTNFIRCQSNLVVLYQYICVPVGELSNHSNPGSPLEVLLNFTVELSKELVMGVQDGINYLIFTNPVSANAISLTKKTLGTIFQHKPHEIPMQTTIITERVPLYRLAQEGGPFIRIGGLFGASAVALGAYGAHKQYPKDKNADLQKIFETGNRYHFFSSLALLSVPMCRYPKISGSLLVLGITLFSGACYYHAITGENKFGKLAPVGGMCLILGWAAMVL